MALQVSVLTHGIHEETQAKPCVLVTSLHGLKQLGLLDPKLADSKVSDSEVADSDLADSGLGGSSDDPVVPASFKCGSKGPLLYPAPPSDFGRVMAAVKAMTRQPQTTCVATTVSLGPCFFTSVLLSLVNCFDLTCQLLRSYL